MPATQAAPGLVVKERTELLPPELEGVGIDEQRGALLPLDLEFADHTGRKLKLRELFDGKRPVILTLNYYKCPMLCTLQLNAMVDALRELDFDPGDQFRVVTVSFDPLETHQLAALKRNSYLAAYGRPQAASGWSFLTGRKASIDQLLAATGFHVRWNEKQQEWVHVAALIICTPDGKISRYLRNVAYEPKTIRMSLVEASEGKIGTAMDQFWLYCYHYDGEGYTFAAMNVVRASGVATLAVVGVFLALLWRRDRRARRLSPTP